MLGRERAGDARTGLRLMLAVVPRDNAPREMPVVPDVRFHVGPASLDDRIGDLDVDEPTLVGGLADDDR